jgi:hypothetical protein
MADKLILTENVLGRQVRYFEQETGWYRAQIARFHFSVQPTAPNLSKLRADVLQRIKVANTAGRSLKARRG